MESLLKTLLEENIEKLFGKDYRIVGNEYRLKVKEGQGLIDILLKHRTENKFVIVELKYNGTDEESITQINKYFSLFLKEHKTRPENVRRVIVDVNIPKHIQEICKYSNIECKIIPKTLFNKWKKTSEKNRISIDGSIINLLKSEKRPLSTREISIKVGVSWHPVMNHCLRLQLAGKVECFTIGKSTAWVIKK